MIITRTDTKSTGVSCHSKKQKLQKVHTFDINMTKFVLSCVVRQLIEVLSFSIFLSCLALLWGGN